MDYQNTLKYLYESVPMFQQVGGQAYKPGLDTTHQLDAYFGHPHRSFRTIHVAGTNGKGSCSHTLAAALQSAGYRVGLFTSPHLVDFRERIRINGKCIPETYVVDFVEQHRNFFEPLHPSFFELTTAMAFRYFADQQVDVAVIEVGMGGRLDCTNIIQPDLCLITNISFDHMQYLGGTLVSIAREKAGIIKPHTPVVIGRAEGDVREVFLQQATAQEAPIFFAQERRSATFPPAWEYELKGKCQEENRLTILTAMQQLQQLGYRLTEEHCRRAFAEVCGLTGLMGRWQRLQTQPEVYCDTGHNVDGIRFIVEQLESIHREEGKQLHIVFGMVSDKDIHSVLTLLPTEATYYFTQASVKRALPAEELAAMAAKVGLQGSCHPNVVEAFRAAQKKCLPEDFIFVGGSSFIVADLLTNRDALNFH